ncbi:MAG: hypothetical protein J5879_10365, partial [Clostridia bacterium]|nr:hypothetical protein [Clostridia bacterium]
MPAIICIFLFIIAATLNLIASAKDCKKLFTATKPALLLLLCLYCLFSGLPKPDLLLIGAFFACWLGDVLLMINGDIWFTAGGVSFFIGHVLLILIFARYIDFSRIPLAVVIPAAAAYLGLSALVMTRSRKKAPKALFVPLCLYLICNSAMNVFALSRLIADPGVWPALSYAGAVLFFLSDCILFLYRYDEDHERFYKNGFFV